MLVRSDRHRFSSKMSTNGNCSAFIDLTDHTEEKEEGGNINKISEDLLSSGPVSKGERYNYSSKNKLLRTLIVFFCVFGHVSVTS